MKKILSILKSRNFKYGSTALFIMILTIVLFIVVNMASTLIYAEMDLTPEKLFSIGDQTVEILDNVDQEVIIYGLFDETKIPSTDAYIKVIELLKKYDAYSNITVKYVDPDRNLGIINELDPDKVLNVTTRNFVVVSEGRKRVLKYFDLFDLMASEYTDLRIFDVGSKAEMAFTSAIHYVTRETYTSVYFITGHNEYTDEEGFMMASDAMRLNGYYVESLNIRSKGSIPEDADILIIANPRTDFHTEEINALKEYMKLGKSLYVLLDSIETNERYPNLQKFLADYSVQFGYNRIKENDPNFYLTGNPYMILPELANSLVNRNIRDSVIEVLARNARTVEKLRLSGSHLKIDDLLITSDRAILEGMFPDVATERRAAYVALAVEDMRSGAKLIISGSSEFMHDTFQYSYRQYAEDASRFFINNVNWLEGDIGQIFIEQKEYFLNIIRMSAGEQQAITIFVVYVLPSIILLMGLIVYLRRRNL